MNRQQSFTNNKATLYVIATPIGNLKEISQRTIEALNNSSIVFCEDTRVSGSLLSTLNIHKPLISAYENIEKSSSSKAIEYLKQGENIAFMSDAGYSGISDPGGIIIQECIKNDFNVVVINGPSALIHSVIASGFDSSHFYFYGFLDPKESSRKKELTKLKAIEDTLIFYQSPHKIKACLEDMLEVLGDRNICICRELTKKFEEFIRGKISEIIPICETFKGEMVIVVNKNEKEISISINKDMIEEINQLIKQNITKKEAIKQIALKYNVSKNELYNYYHKEDLTNE